MTSIYDLYFYTYLNTLLLLSLYRLVLTCFKVSSMSVGLFLYLCVIYLSLPVLSLPSIPQDLSDDLMEWFDESNDVFASLKDILQSAFSERVKRLHDLRKKAGDIIWWPFTQHGLVSEEKVTVIDSRCGENFAVHKVAIWFLTYAP